MINTPQYDTVIETKMEDQEPQIRRVTGDDFHSVMDIIPTDQIYFGVDYLPDYFHMLLNMPNVEAYATIIGDKFVSFELFTIVDDGKTVVSRACRTRPGFTGRRFTSTMFTWLTKVSMERQKFEYQVLTSYNYIKQLLRRLERGELYKVLDKEFRNYASATGEFKFQMEKKAACQTQSSAKLINAEELAELLSSPKLRQQYFPEGRIIVDWVPYRPMKSNASLIKTDRTSIVASQLYESERGVLTFVNHFVAAFGLIFNLDVYGFIDSTLKDHLILHCNEPLSVANPENVLIRCFGREGTDWKCVTTLMKSFGLEELEKAGTGQILCEQKIEVPKSGHS